MGGRGRPVATGLADGRSLGSMVRKRPCSLCGSWFQPDARVGARQHACSGAECQQRRRRRKQAQWRRRNPDYFVARRWTAAVDDAAEAGPGRSPAPLEQVPWDVVQSQMGAKAAVIIGLLLRVLVLHLQSQMLAQSLAITAKSPRLPPQRAQSQMATEAAGGHPGSYDERAGGNPR